MTVDVLGLHLSPRRNGNSAILLDTFLKGAREGGAQTASFSVDNLKIDGCHECGGCAKDGHCIIKNDGMSEIYPLLAEAPLVVVSASLFFYDVPAQGKALIDRSQALWSRRYILGQNKDGRPGTKGFLIAVGATKGLDLFVPVTLSIKYFFDALGLPKQFDSLCYRQVEGLGDINKHPDYLNETYEAGLAFGKSRPGGGSQGCS